MDLREWDAMTEEEQTKYFMERGGAVEHPEYAGALGELAEKAVDAIGRSEPSTACCEIRDRLTKQLDDELDGISFYAIEAGELAKIGETGLSDMMRNISDTEYQHYLELLGTIQVLDEKCKCTPKKEE